MILYYIMLYYIMLYYIILFYLTYYIILYIYIFVNLTRTHVEIRALPLVLYSNVPSGVPGTATTIRDHVPRCEAHGAGI